MEHLQSSTKDDTKRYIFEYLNLNNQNKIWLFSKIEDTERRSRHQSYNKKEFRQIAKFVS